MSHQIYGLYDPRVKPRVIRYVGHTGKELAFRLKYHCIEARKKTTCHRTKWVMSLLKDGITPAIVALEQVTQDNWMTKERSWISKLSKTGNLTNSTAGGEGLVNPTQDVRDRIAKTLRDGGTSLGNQHRKGIAHSDEDKVKISAGMRNSEKFKDAMGKLAGINRHANMTPEQLKAKGRKIGASKIGKRRKPFSEATKNLMSLAHLGTTHSAKTKEKISDRIKNSTKFQEAMERQKGVAKGPQSPEHLAKLSAARLGRKMITDGVSKKYLKSNEPMPDGWWYIRP